MKNNFDRIVILIPALNPNEGIVKLVRELKEEKFSNILIINDGSKIECKKYFDVLKNEKNVKVIEHNVNLRKRTSFKNRNKRNL